MSLHAIGPIPVKSGNLIPALRGLSQKSGNWRRDKAVLNYKLELELELIQTQMAQKPMLRAEVGMRVRCAKQASIE